MIVTKGKNTVTLKLENETDFESIVMSEDLFWADLSFYHSHWDGWQYLYDANRNIVFLLTDYGFDELSTLLKKKQITLEGRPNDDVYDEYEWNEE